MIIDTVGDFSLDVVVVFSKDLLKDLQRIESFFTHDVAPNEVKD